jgi:hypothetical protein
VLYNHDVLVNIDVSISGYFFGVKHEEYKKLFETAVRFTVSALYSPENSTTNYTAVFRIIIYYI